MTYRKASLWDGVAANLGRGPHPSRFPQSNEDTVILCTARVSLVAPVSNELSSGKAPIAASRCLTRIGRVLGETGIDQLPQLFNVLRGEVSIAGLLHAIRPIRRDGVFLP